jgi:5-methylthioribose kinase
VDPSRLEFEAEALLFLEARFDDGAVRAPHLYDYDAGSSVLVEEDLGDADHLGERLGAGTARREDGEALGHFLGRLHARTLGDEGRAEEHRNVPVQETRREVQYQGVARWLADAGLPDEGLGAAAADLGERLCERGRCLIMGDLWPPSVLACEGGWRLVDWEFSHFGRPCQDLGHLLAHLWLAADRAASDEVREAVEAYRDGFLAGYRAGGGADTPALLDEETRTDTLTHLRCEVAARTIGAFAEGEPNPGAMTRLESDLAEGWVLL